MPGNKLTWILCLSHLLTSGFAGFGSSSLQGPHGSAGDGHVLLQVYLKMQSTEAMSSWGEQGTPEGFVGYLGAVTEHVLMV